MSVRRTTLLGYEPGRTAGVGYYYGDGRLADDRPAQVLSAAGHAADAPGLARATGASASAEFYVAYLPYGGRVRLRLAGDRTRLSERDELTDGDGNRAHEVMRFGPRTGARTLLAGAAPGGWISPWSEGPADLVYLLLARDQSASNRSAH